MKQFKELRSELNEAKVKGPRFLAAKGLESPGTIKIEVNEGGEISISNGTLFVGTMKTGKDKGKFLGVVSSFDLSVTWITKKSFADAAGAKAALPKPGSKVTFDDLYDSLEEY